MLIVVPAAIVVVVGVLTGAVRASGGLRSPREPDSDGRWRAARRRAAWCRAAAVPAGLAAAVVVARWDALGRGVALAAPVFALVLLVGVVLGELSFRPPETVVRTATLDTRRAVDYLPRRLAGAVLLAGGGLLALAVATTLAAGADTEGRAGRALRTADGGVYGPWPGSFYTVPITAIVIAGFVVGALALRRVARRPRLGGSAGLVAADESLRRQAGETVTAACGVLAAVPLSGVAVFAAVRLAATPGPSWWPDAGWALLAVAVLALGLTGWCLAVLVAPRGRPAPAPA